MTAIAHLHVAQNRRRQNLQRQDLQRQGARISSTTERICIKFARLLFWDVKPENIEACKYSLQDWVMGSGLRSLQREWSTFFEEHFRNRNKKPLLTSVVEVLFNQTAPSALEKDFAPKSLMDFCITSRIVEDIHYFECVAFLLAAVRDDT